MQVKSPGPVPGLFSFVPHALDAMQPSLYGSRMSSHLQAASRTAAIPTDEGTLDSGFAARLREATKSVHREAERTGFIADLIRGRATRAGYALLLRNLVPVYSALEDRLHAAAGHANPMLACFTAPGLPRKPHLVADLQAIAGDDWLDAYPVLPEAEAYADAVHRAEARDSARLAAHAYARYLGDLSGGQILKPLLTRTLQLGPKDLTFYDFPTFANPDVAKHAIREALDTLDPSGPAADAFVDEAIAAFRHNIHLSMAIAKVGQTPAS